MQPSQFTTVHLSLTHTCPTTKICCRPWFVLFSFLFFVSPNYNHSEEGSWHEMSPTRSPGVAAWSAVAPAFCIFFRKLPSAFPCFYTYNYILKQYKKKFAIVIQKGQKKCYPNLIWFSQEKILRKLKMKRNISSFIETKHGGKYA